MSEGFRRRPSRKYVAAVCLLLVGGLLFVLADNREPWRDLQVQDANLRVDMLRQQIAAEEARSADALEQQRNLLEKHHQEWRSHRNEISELEEQRRDFDHKRGLAATRAGRSRRAFERASRDVGLGASVADRAALDELRRAMHLDRREVEELAELVADRQLKLDALRMDLTAAEAALDELQEPLHELRHRLDEATIPAPLRWSLLSPLAPSVGVREIVPEVLAPTLPPAVERCTTCHLGVLDGARGDSWPPVLRSHPRPELFLEASSPHPLGTFGCTVCHGGDGRSTDFRRADHDRTGDDPHLTMLPKPLVEASCRQCHGAAVGEVAQRLADGQRRLHTLGCRNCHAGGVAGKSASSLDHLVDKTTRRWAYEWLRQPAAGHPVLAGHVSGHVSGDGRSETTSADLEARLLVDYLWGRYRAVDRPSPPTADPREGEALFRSLGCEGCHGGAATPQNTGDHGPSLTGSHAKLRPSWLFAWLRDPRAVNADTTMPDLRLSADEAAALTAFLVDGQVQPRPSSDESLPPVDEDERDRRLLDALSNDMTLRAAQARLEGLSGQQRNVLLGELLFEAQGCHGCHGSPRLPATTMAAPPLEGLDGKAVARLASSHVPQLSAALAAATGRPEGEGVASTEVPLEPGGDGPRYDLDKPQALGLLTALLAPSVQVADRLQAVPSATAVRGEELLARWGCRGCHRLDGWGGEAFSDGDPQQRPPRLDGVGERLRADWLSAYLEDPSTVIVRPWLTARMPSYELPADDRIALVEYFVERSRVSALHHDVAPATSQDLTVGRLVFEILQCERCHSEADDPGGMEVPELSPDYQLAAQRLRPQWVIDWLLEPRRFRPATSMPSYFGEAGQGDLEYLSRTFDSPMFFVQRQRLLRAFEDDEAMEAYLLDHRRVATALRDYVWSLGESPDVR